MDLKIQKTLFILICANFLFICNFACCLEAPACAAAGGGSSGSALSSTGESARPIYTLLKTTKAPTRDALAYDIASGCYDEHDPYPLSSGAPIHISEHARLRVEKFGHPSKKTSEKHLIEAQDLIILKTLSALHKAFFAHTRNARVNHLFLNLFVAFADPGFPSHLTTISGMVGYNRTENTFCLFAPQEEGDVEWVDFFSSDKMKSCAEIARLSTDTPFTAEVSPTEALPFHFVYYPFSNSFCQAFGLNPAPGHSETSASAFIFDKISLFEDLFRKVPSGRQLAYIGAKFFSFLDLCPGCRAFVPSIQLPLKELLRHQGLSRTYPHLFPSESTLRSLPFLTVGASIRLFRDNIYPISPRCLEELPYSPESKPAYLELDIPSPFGGIKGTFVPNLTQHSGVFNLTPKPDRQYQLLLFTLEPDQVPEKKTLRESLPIAASVEASKFTMRDSGAAAISHRLSMIEDPSHLREMNLSRNRFGIKEEEDLGSEFFLSDCDGSSRLLGQLSRFTNMEVLDLSDNFFGGDTLPDALIASLYDLPKLKKLNLFNCRIKREDVIKLIGAFECLPLLEDVNLGANPLGYKGCEALALALSNLSYLKKIGIAFTGPGYKFTPRKHFKDPVEQIYDNGGLMSLLSALERLPALEEVDIRFDSKDTEIKMAEKRKILEGIIAFKRRLEPKVSVISRDEPFFSRHQENEIHLKKIIDSIVSGRAHIGDFMHYLRIGDRTSGKGLVTYMGDF